MAVSDHHAPKIARRAPRYSRYLLVVIPVFIACALVGRPLFRQLLAYPLITAVTKQDSGAVAELLRRGASANAVDGEGHTVLSIAMEEYPSNAPLRKLATWEQIVGMLLTAGADPNKMSSDPSNLYSTSTQEPYLFGALQEHSLAVVKDLLAHGVDPNATCSESPALIHAVLADSELHLSGKSQNPQFTLTLLAAGADARVHRPAVKGASEHATWTDYPLIYQEELPLLVAVRYADRDKGNVVLIKTLLAHGAIIDARDHAGQTALSLAAAKGDAADVRILLASGADANLPDRDGQTPLQVTQASLSVQVKALARKKPVSHSGVGVSGGAIGSAGFGGAPGGYPGAAASSSTGGTPLMGLTTSGVAAAGNGLPSLQIRKLTPEQLAEQEKVQKQKQKQLTDLRVRYGIVEALLATKKSADSH